MKTLDCFSAGGFDAAWSTCQKKRPCKQLIVLTNQNSFFQSGDWIIVLVSTANEEIRIQYDIQCGKYFQAKVLSFRLM